jgi:hypothetical protein
METWDNQQSAVQTGGKPHQRRGYTGWHIFQVWKDEWTDANAGSTVVSRQWPPAIRMYASSPMTNATPIEDCDSRFMPVWLQKVEIEIEGGEGST